MLSLEKRFLDYISYDTQSDSSAVGIRRPTTEGQERLLKHLGDELEALGLDVYYGQENVVMGKLKGTCSGKCIAFMAHVDTSDETAGNGVKPIVNRAYDGGSIALPYLTITPEDEPDLLLYKGSTIITSDGSTLLGADDKAGCAIIIEALSRLVSAHDSLYPDIEVFFTPDEETGAGMDGFDYEKPVVRMDPLFVGYLDGLYADIFGCSFHFGRGAGHGCRHFVWICGLSALSVCPFEVVASGVIRCFPGLF